MYLMKRFVLVEFRKNFSPRQRRLHVQESPRSQPALDATVASAQIAKDDHQITKGQGEEDTEL